MGKLNMLVLLLLIFGSCRYEKLKEPDPKPVMGAFDPAMLQVDQPVSAGLKGQVLYMPVYSNIPYHIVGMEEFDMSAFIAIHNTDLYNRITVIQALFFDKMGKPVSDFLTNGKIILDPLATEDFFVPYENGNGNGANFLIEWISDSLVTEPLVESVTISLKPNQSVAVLSKGKVIREIK